MQMMASSLNGLTFGDTLSENLMDSPARSDSMLYLRDDASSQYSPMSEDSDDSRYYDNSSINCPSQPESAPTSPVSPYRYQRSPTPYSSAAPRQRGSDTEGRFPSSPSDICHSADLRRAALLRSVQIRSQGQDPWHHMETEERPCSYTKLISDEREYHVTSSGAGGGENHEQDPGHHRMETEERPCSHTKSLCDEREYHVVASSGAARGEGENREESCRRLDVDGEKDKSETAD